MGTVGYFIWKNLRSSNSAPFGYLPAPAGFGGASGAGGGGVTSASPTNNVLSLANTGSSLLNTVGNIVGGIGKAIGGLFGGGGSGGGSGASAKLPISDLFGGGKGGGSGTGKEDNTEPSSIAPPEGFPAGSDISEGALPFQDNSPVVGSIDMTNFQTEIPQSNVSYDQQLALSEQQQLIFDQIRQQDIANNPSLSGPLSIPEPIAAPYVPSPVPVVTIPGAEDFSGFPADIQPVGTGYYDYQDNTDQSLSDFTGFA